MMLIPAIKRQLQAKPAAAQKVKNTSKPKRDFGNAAMGNAFADAFANAKVKK